MTEIHKQAINADSLGIDHLRSFIAVVESGSQVRAAKRLGIAQTTVCRHIERIQEHFGGGLFKTGASGALSTRGLMVEQSARTVVAELARARERLALDSPVLRIGFTRSLRPLVEKALRSGVKARGVAHFEVRLIELTGEMSARALERRELDIAIAYAIPDLVNREGLEETPVADDPYALVFPERALQNGEPSLAILRSLLFAYTPPRISSRLQRASEQWLAQHRLTPTRTVECALGSEILAYAGAGHGFGILPAIWAMAGHEGAAFARIDVGVSAKIAAYSLHHVAPWVTQLRKDLSTAARDALRSFRRA